MKEDCIFCAIVNGAIPSYKIYEDAHFLAILDRFPKCLGHVLLMPKQHTDNLFDLPVELATNLLPVAQKIAHSLQKVLNCKGLNLLQNNGEVAGQEISHFHLHLIPRFDEDKMLITYTNLNPSHNEFEEVLAKIKAVI